MLYTLEHLRAIFFRLGGFGLKLLNVQLNVNVICGYLGFDTCQGA